MLLLWQRKCADEVSRSGDVMKIREMRYAGKGRSAPLGVQTRATLERSPHTSAVELKKGVDEIFPDKHVGDPKHTC